VAHHRGLAASGEIVGEHVAKGSKVYVEGSSRPQAGRIGKRREENRTEIVARDLLLLGPRETAAATTNVRRTMRIRTSLPTPAPAKSWTRISF